VGSYPTGQNPCHALLVFYKKERLNNLFLETVYKENSSHRTGHGGSPQLVVKTTPGRVERKAITKTPSVKGRSRIILKKACYYPSYQLWKWA